jgi:hypothetical protein
MNMRDMKRSVLSLIAVLVFVSCARAKTITADELRSHLLSALSLASETDLFIGQIDDMLTAMMTKSNAVN